GRQRRDAVEVEDARSPCAVDRRIDLRGAHDRQDHELNRHDTAGDDAGFVPFELVAGIGEAEIEQHDDDQRAEHRLRAQPRPGVLDEDRVIQPVAQAVPHQESSLDPTLRNRSSRLSRLRANPEMRTPCWTRVASSSLAARASPRKRNSYVSGPRRSIGPARSSAPTIQWKSSGSPSTSTDRSVSPMTRWLTSSIRPATTTW